MSDIGDTISEFSGDCSDGSSDNFFPTILSCVQLPDFYALDRRFAFLEQATSLADAFDHVHDITTSSCLEEPRSVPDPLDVAIRSKLRVLDLVLRIHVEMVMIIGEHWEDEGYMLDVPSASLAVSRFYALTEEWTHRPMMQMSSSAPPSPRGPCWVVSLDGKLDVYNSTGDLLDSNYTTGAQRADMDAG